jgi:two-component system, NarL family, sensor kinase
MQGDNEIIILLMLGILSSAVLVMTIVLFVSIYHRRMTEDKLKIESLRLRQSEELIESITLAQEEERKRISSQLHDSIGATLSSINLLVGRIQIESSGTIPELAEKAILQIDNISTELRGIIRNMSPLYLERFGLLESVHEMCRIINSTGSISAKFVSDQIEPDFDSSENRLLVYRIVQELINNVIKHSGATQMDISSSIDDSLLMISVSDNGKGFDSSDELNFKGQGLRNIKSRIELAGGSFTISRNNNDGIKAVIEIKVNSSL